MKNLKLVLGIFLALVVCTLPSRVRARVVNNPSSSVPDAWCTNGGGSYSGGNVTGAEDCVDYNGNLLPTTSNTQSLGTSSLVWSTVYATNEVTTGYNELAIQTTTQLALRSDPVGATFYAEERVGGALVTNAFNLCVSTAAAPASYVYVAVSTSAAAIAGKACAN